MFINLRVLAHLPVIIYLICSWAAAQDQPLVGRPSPGQSMGPESENQVLVMSGVVVMDDSSALPNNLQVEMLCDERVIRQERPSDKGQFTFIYGSSNPQEMMDASAFGPAEGLPGAGQSSSWNDTFGGAGGFRTAGLGRYDLSRCEVRIQPTPGLYANSIRLGIRSIFDEPDIGVIVIRRLGEKGGTTVSVTTLDAPEEARKSYENAQKALSDKEPDLTKAVSELEQGLEIYPEFSEAWNLLGTTRRAMGDIEGSRAAYQQAIAADDRYILPYMNLAKLEIDQQRYQQVAELTKRLIELNPYILEVRYMDGVANYYLGNLDAAESSFRFIEPNTHYENHFRIFLFLGLIHAQRGQIPEAGAALRTFLKMAPDSQIPEDIRGRLENQLLQWEEAGLIPPETAPQEPGG